MVSLKAFFLDHYTLAYLFPSDKTPSPFPVWDTLLLLSHAPGLPESLLLCWNGAVLDKSRLVEHTHHAWGPLTWDCRQWLGYWIGRREDWSTHFPGGTEPINGAGLGQSMQSTVQGKIRHSLFLELSTNINRFEDSVWYPGDRKAHAHLQGQRNSPFSGRLLAAFCWETAAHGGSLLSHIILLHMRLHRWRRFSFHFNSSKLSTWVELAIYFF